MEDAIVSRESDPKVVVPTPRAPVKYELAVVVEMRFPTVS